MSKISLRAGTIWATMWVGVALVVLAQALIS
jgi:hypothetical protein